MSNDRELNAGGEVDIYLNDELGQGQFGKVYRGMYEKRQPCAVKVFNKLTHSGPY